MIGLLPGQGHGTFARFILDIYRCALSCLLNKQKNCRVKDSHLVSWQTVTTSCFIWILSFCLILWPKTYKSNLCFICITKDKTIWSNFFYIYVSSLPRDLFYSHSHEVVFRNSPRWANILQENIRCKVDVSEWTLLKLGLTRYIYLTILINLEYKSIEYLNLHRKLLQTKHLKAFSKKIVFLNKITQNCGNWNHDLNVWNFYKSQLFGISRPTAEMSYLFTQIAPIFKKIFSFCGNLSQKSGNLKTSTKYTVSMYHKANH